MTESQIISMIKQIVRQELAPILMATVTSNKDQNRSTITRFQTDAPVPNARNIQPFGVSSRAPASTPCLIIPIDSQPTHLNMVGHFDESRPTVEDGELALYGADGQLIYFKTGGEIHQGTKDADEPVVLGNVLKEFLTKLLDEDFLNPTQVCYDAFGLPVFLDPQVRQKMIEQKQKYLTDAATNIVGQKNFVERGG